MVLASSGKPQAQSPVTNHAVRLSLFWCFCTVAFWVGMVRNPKRKTVLRNPSSNGASLNGKPIAQGRLGYLISLLSQNHRVQFKPGRPFSKAPCWIFDLASNVCDSHTKPCNNIAVQIQRCQKWNGFVLFVRIPFHFYRKNLRVALFSSNSLTWKTGWSLQVTKCYFPFGFPQDYFKHVTSGGFDLHRDSCGGVWCWHSAEQCNNCSTTPQSRRVSHSTLWSLWACDPKGLLCSHVAIGDPSWCFPESWRDSHKRR